MTGRCATRRSIADSGLAAAMLSLLLVEASAAAGASASFKAGTFDPPRLAPDFSLQGSDGHELRIGRFRGKVVLLAFGYSSCTQVCPVTLATFAQARRQLGAAAAEVQVVYVTVDPQRDGPERLKRDTKQRRVRRGANDD